MRRNVIAPSFTKKRRTLQQMKDLIEQKIADYYSDLNSIPATNNDFEAKL